MTDDMMMTHDRFCALAAAYGGDVARWPTDEQAPARALLAEDASLTAVLGEAGAIDAILASSADPAFSGVLREKLIAAAPRPGGRLKARARWITGISMAAACAAGVAMGANYSDRIIGTDSSNAPATWASTSFDGQADILGLGETG